MCWRMACHDWQRCRVAGAAHCTVASLSLTIARQARVVPWCSQRPRHPSLDTSRWSVRPHGRLPARTDHKGLIYVPVAAGEMRTWRSDAALRASSVSLIDQVQEPARICLRCLPDQCLSFNSPSADSASLRVGLQARRGPGWVATDHTSRCECWLVNPDWRPASSQGLGHHDCEEEGLVVSKARTCGGGVQMHGRLHCN